MTRQTWRKVLHGALDALELPVGHPGGSSGSIQRVDDGYLIELVTGWPATCPHCGKQVPAPVTRRRRLRRVVAGGRVLSVEIEP